MLKRTTLFAEEEVLDQYRRLAREDGKSVAEVERQALQEYLDRRQSRHPLESLIGIGRSREKNLSERVDELLWQDSRLGKRLKKQRKK